MSSTIEKHANTLQAIEGSIPDELKKELPYLLAAGGGGALLAGLATGGRRERKGESRSGYAARIAKNMALAGLLAGGGAFALRKGIDATKDSIDFEHPKTGADPTLNPVGSLVRNVAFSPITAGLSTAGTLAALKPDNTKAAKEAARILFGGKDAKSMAAFDESVNLRNVLTGEGRTALDNKVRNVLYANPAERKGMVAGVERVLADAGVPTMGAKLGPDASILKRVLASEEALYRTTAGRVLGQRMLPAAGRTAAGAAAFMLPSLIGSLITDPATAQP